VSVALAPLTAVLGPEYLACVLVGAYWTLHFASRHMLSRSQVEEQSMLLPALAGLWQRARSG